jgi:MinD superfamily P-loop ATPase
MGVVVNRAGLGTTAVYDYCNAAGLETLAVIPYERNIAQAYAQGKIIAESSRELRRLFVELAKKIKTLHHRQERPKEVCVG